MSIRRKLLAIAAVSTLTAAAAVPAMAFENEIHGAFGVRAVNSNYLGYQVNGSGTGYLLGGNAGAGSGAVGSAIVARADSTLTENFIDQRARIFYSAKASDNLKLVTGFELDATWGKSSYAVDRNNGGAALGADTTNLETKWVYLDFNVPSTKVNVKVGLQGLNDAYKNLIVGGGADAAGLVVSAPVGPATLTAGWFRLDDHVATPSYAPGGAAGFIPGASTSTNANFSDGKRTRDLLILDAKVAVTKDVKVGGSYYFLNDDKSQNAAAQGGVNSWGPGIGGAIPSGSDYAVHIFGLNAAATFGPATIDGYFVYESGTVDSWNISNSAPGAVGFGSGANALQHVNAYALNLAGKLKAGPGTAKVNALYVSGGTAFSGGNSLGNGFISINNQTSGAFCENALGGSFGNMFLLVRNSQLNMSTADAAIAYDSSNRWQGIIGGSLGYDANITDKLGANFNVGFLATAAQQHTTQGKYEGTELNGELTYKIYDNLTASARAAYVFLGDYYSGQGALSRGGVATDPANPYLLNMSLAYTF